MIDITGKEIIAPTYDSLIATDRFFQVSIGNKWGLIDITGKEIIPILYDSFRVDANNPIRVKSGEKWALFDYNGKEILPPTYDDIAPFFDGYAHVMLKKKWRMVDTNGKEILPPIFVYKALEIRPEGLVVVTNKNLLGLADLNGNIILPIKYSHIGGFSPDGPGYYWYNKNRKGN